MKGILISLAAVFVKASARLVACSRESLHFSPHELGLYAKHVLKVLSLAQLLYELGRATFFSAKLFSFSPNFVPPEGNDEIVLLRKSK